MQQSDLLKQLGLSDVNAGAVIGGETLSADKTAINLTSINPGDAQPIANVTQATAKDYEAMISSALDAQEKWQQVPAPRRAEVIYHLSQLLREHKSALGSLVALEMGKSKAEGDGEVQEMIDMADFAIGQSRMLYGKTIASERPQHRLMEQWHPLGVVGVITAFNFPVAVWAWNAFLAIICGNTVIWKPSSKTPLCAVAVHKLCEQVSEKLDCPALFNLLITDNHVAEQMLADPRMALLSFTGSCAVGQHVANKVASRFGKYCLELGGNNAIIVSDQANLNLAIPAIVFGAIGTAGQRCTTTRRIIVHESIRDTVIGKLKQAYQQVKIGDPLDANNTMGPLIDAQAVESFKLALQTATKQGGDILRGGNVLELPGYYVEPTIVKIDHRAEVVQQETFAPILYVHTYRQLEDAIAIQNQVPQGLSSAIFSDSLSEVELFLSSQGSDCGLANVNVGTSGAEIGGAFGGEKATGGGREAGSDAWQTYMRRQTVTLNWGKTLPLAQGIEFN